MNLFEVYGYPAHEMKMTGELRLWLEIGMKACRYASCLGVLIGASFSLLLHKSHAAAFQIWEQDGATVGNYHAGYAAGQGDASSAFYNPAGLTALDHQQLVVAGIGVMPNIKYDGTISVDTLSNGAPQSVVAQGGTFVFAPALQFASPLSDRVTFGFSIVAPFGLETNYANTTEMRYVATTSSIISIDVSPSIGYKLTDNLSIGAGPDYQYATAEFDLVGTMGGRESDSDGINKATGSGYGYHMGFIYKLTHAVRFGLSYHSQVVHHLTGTSTFSGPLTLDYGTLKSKRTKLDIRLPAYTAASIHYDVTPKLAVMSSLIYTQWNVIRQLVLQDVSGLKNSEASNSIVVTIPQYFRNTWNVSLGTDYRYNDMVTWRAGIGFDQTPVQDAYRNVQLPDNDRYVVALGTHVQPFKTVGYDLSWMHLFAKKANINPPEQIVGDENINTNGSVTGGADVLAFQVTWDIV